MGYPTKLLADDESTHRRSEDGVARVRGEFRAKQFNQTRDLIHVLADLGALEEMAAMETGAQDEVPGQEGLRVTENLKDFFLGRAHAASG